MSWSASSRQSSAKVASKLPTSEKLKDLFAIPAILNAGPDGTKTVRIYAPNR